MEIKNILLGVFGTLVFVLGGFIIYDNFFNSNEQVIEQKPNKEEVKNESETNININKLDLSKLPKDFDGTYGSIKGITSGSNYANLAAEGSVTVCDSNGCNRITNINNAIDIIYFTNADDFSSDIYILASDGAIYKYVVNSKSFRANKVDNVNNIVRIFDYDFCPEKNAGCNTTLYGITANNEYTIIAANAF